jgi:RNA polymerase sigma factor (TIGR02999 family)
MSDVSRILAQIRTGDLQAAEQLLPLVYGELRRLAAARLAHEQPGQTLQATALVHEAYLRLVDQSRPQTWENQAHFFAAAAEAMRRILVESARQKASLKRGGDKQRLPLGDLAACGDGDAEELLALDEALQRLAQADAQAAQVVKFRYFAGLTMDETAQALGISSRTAYYAWEYARSWLRQELRDGESSG